MASGLHVLAQQKVGVEARIKLLVNPDLKEICKAYGYPVSGTKAVLQKRCIDILNNLVKGNDMNAFLVFSFRVNNHGRPPPPGSLTSSATSSQKYQPTSSAQPATPRHVSAQNRLSSRGKCTFATLSLILPLSPTKHAELTTHRIDFKESPFYEVLDTVLPLLELQGNFLEIFPFTKDALTMLI
nr:e3 sumo-protein ligase pli1 [Quercus suber]